MVRDVRELIGEAVAAPLGDVIAAVGRGVAAAQQALDDASLAKTLEIYGAAGEETHRLLREIGYRPTFYALPETTGEVRVSLSLSGEGDRTAPEAAGMPERLGRTSGGAPKLYATPVDAGFAGRYGYRADVAAKLTFKIVPVPAPGGADELRLVPKLVERGAAECAAALAALGLAVRFVDADGSALTEGSAPETPVIAQSPEPDAILRIGDAVTLTVKS